MKKLQLLLTSPCVKQWDDLQPAGNGRYCGSCEKHIVDLSGKTDAELIAFFKKKKDNVCGRLLASQLGRELVLPQTKPSWHWLMPLAVGAIIASPAQAQELRPMVAQNVQPSPSRPASIKGTLKTSVAATTFRGTVVDDRSGEPLKGVKVKQQGFVNVLAVTDSLGKFEFSAPLLSSAGSFIFEFNGYATLATNVTDGVQIKMTKQQVIMLGGISAISLTREPMYLIYAGKQSCTLPASRIKEIEPDWIQNIEVLNGAKATALYGSKAALGVILIEIKKEHVKKIDFSKK